MLIVTIISMLTTSPIAILTVILTVSNDFTNVNLCTISGKVSTAKQL